MKLCFQLLAICQTRRIWLSHFFFNILGFWLSTFGIRSAFLLWFYRELVLWYYADRWSTREKKTLAIFFPSSSYESYFKICYDLSDYSFVVDFNVYIDDGMQFTAFDCWYRVSASVHCASFISPIFKSKKLGNLTNTIRTKCVTILF